LNWIVLRSKSWEHTLHFRGTVERDVGDLNGRNLHYHFALWAPANLFIRNPQTMHLACTAIQSLWVRLVNDQITDRYKPIVVKTVTKKQDLDYIAKYENKANSLQTSYELFDDWSTSRLASANKGDAGPSAALNNSIPSVIRGTLRTV
jgi:hypothetical protein